MEKKFTWKSFEETPSDVHEPILYMTVNNKLGVFKNTEQGMHPESSSLDRLKEKYNVKYWVYQKELVL